MISEELLAILACPVCKGDLESNAGQSVLLCRHCRLHFPIRNDIPILLREEAEQLS